MFELDKIVMDRKIIASKYLKYLHIQDSNMKSLVKLK